MDNLEDISFKLLFLSSFQRKLKDCPLLEVDSIAGNCKINTEIYSKTEIINTHNYRSNIIKIRNSSRAEIRLNEVFPTFSNLKFDGYCLAGGAALWAIRKFDRHSVSNPNDLDFFPVVGEVSGNNWKNEKQDRARQIYEKFVLEMKEIETQLVHFNLLVWENENCTTFSFQHSSIKAHENLDNKCQYCIRQSAYEIKFSFIHRAYDTPEQIVQGFDFAPSQVIYDGKTFKCSYAAAFSICHNSLPVDISAASDSFYARLNKYNSEKCFNLIFPGLDSRKIGMERYSSKQKNSNPFRVKFPKGANLWIGDYNHNVFNLGYGENPTIDPQAMNKETDYGDIAEILLCQNEDYLVKQFLKTGMVYGKKKSCSAEYQYLDIERGIRKICAFDERLPISTFELLQLFSPVFEEDLDEAMLLYLKREQFKFNPLLEKHLPKIINLYETKKSKPISFMVDEPGMQIRRSFNPVDLTARVFYGHYYNGFHCTPDWPARCQIIIAYRKERTGKRDLDQCCLFWLDLNLIKFIFKHLDKIYFEEIKTSFFDHLEQNKE